MGINKNLGLPFGDGMQKIALCVDVDGTLIDDGEGTYMEIVDLVKIFSTRFKNIKVVVWSGGGESYARTIGERIGLGSYVWKYMSKLQYKELTDAGYLIVAIDDVQDTRLGDVNLIVRNK